MFRKSLILFFSLLILSGITSAQQLVNGWDRDWDDYDMFEWSSDSNPFIEVNYGIVNPKHNIFSTDFQKLGAGEVKLGFSSRDVYFENYITEFDEKFFFVSNLSKDFANEDLVTDIEMKAWRFGMGTREGYGYRFGRTFAILPYHQGAISWTRLNYVQPNIINTLAPVLTQEDNDILDRYEDSFRFGTIAEGGIMLEFGSMVSVNAAYEASVIFPRFMTWKYLGSLVIEGAGVAFIDYFVDEVIDSSPAAGPIVNFVLRNAFSLAMHSLKRDEMNWPFSTETPMTFETVKVGMSFRF
ncbi:MAG: hypothetical protein SCALA702_11960 [Melioribacteraceae bacterium]|nr:MAG: hypothetical protein SCALA702_11960 [Melioribacteraceae bacterium]